MSYLNKYIFRYFFILMFGFQVQSYAQEKSFYIRSLEGFPLINDSLIFQKVNFKTNDLVYNKLIDFSNEKIQITETGTYEVNGFVNINPGVSGKTDKDKIEIAVYLIKNENLPSKEILFETRYLFIYQNLDVSHSFNIYVEKIKFNVLDEIQIMIKILPTSTISINQSQKYNHVNKPTGMPQIAGLRIKKTDA